MDKYTDNEKRAVLAAYEQPKGWKKMHKKERDRWLEEKIEQWRAEKEAEKLVSASVSFVGVFLLAPL